MVFISLSGVCTLFYRAQFVLFPLYLVSDRFTESCSAIIFNMHYFTLSLYQKTYNILTLGSSALPL